MGASITHMFKNVEDHSDTKGLKLCGLVTHKGLIMPLAGHTQRVNSDEAVSHTNG